MQKTWIIRIDATNGQFNQVAAAAKAAGCPFVMFANPQSVKACTRAREWFEENE